MQRLAALAVLLLLAIAGYVGYIYKSTGQLPDVQKIAESISSMSSQVSEKSPQVQNVTTDASTQLNTLTERAGQVSQHTQNVLGSSIQVNNQIKKPIHESAIEYGRYIYCKQVVEDYETAVEKAETEESAN
ncbi:MAG: hypothetical protein QG639_184 [Patescibacteria group bacterium]|nr:hypothetical protein [Patescibacteria group bacterium]